MELLTRKATVWSAVSITIVSILVGTICAAYHWPDEDDGGRITILVHCGVDAVAIGLGLALIVLVVKLIIETR